MKITKKTIPLIATATLILAIKIKQLIINRINNNNNNNNNNQKIKNE